MHRTNNLKIENGKEQSYTSTPPLCLQGRLQGEYLYFYLYLYIKQLSKWPGLIRN
jgi:hypothetical protein